MLIISDTWFLFQKTVLSVMSTSTIKCRHRHHHHQQQATTPEGENNRPIENNNLLDDDQGVVDEKSIWRFGVCFNRDGWNPLLTFACTEFGIFARLFANSPAVSRCQVEKSFIKSCVVLMFDDGRHNGEVCLVFFTAVVISIPMSNTYHQGS